MPTQSLLTWQWQGYARNHQSRANLLLHIVAVPVFMVSNLGLFYFVDTQQWGKAAACIGAMAFSLLAQGRGHRLEAVPPEPFTGPGNAVARLLLEQWINFPRFVISGAWWRALRGRP